MKPLFSLLITLLSLSYSTAQTTATGSLNGTIKENNGSPVPYSTVTLKGTKYGAATDDKGHFSIKKIPVGTYELVFSGIGFEPLSQTVNIKAGENQTLDLMATPKSVEVQQVQVKGVRNIQGIGHLDEVHENVVYAGIKNEVVVLDSLNANVAQDNPRQVLGRVPGINFSETEGNGFPSNGMGVRGLNPTQSVEMNVRQNGYNLAADIYGYPESYYQTPLEAVERIEVVRGAASLQYGPQFGGVVNYIIKKGPEDKPFEFTTEQTVGSYWLFNSFNSIGGTYKKLNYYAFAQFRTTDGWRPNSGYRQFTGFARLQWQVSKKVSLSAEYSILRNRVQMPGGLSDAQFDLNPDYSNRPRNWITTPWNLATVTLEYQINNRTALSIKSSVLRGKRELVWRAEDVGADVADTIDPATGTYVPRELEKEAFLSSTTELRLTHTYNIRKTSNTLAAGVRFFGGVMQRKEEGEGTDGTDFDLTLVGYEYESDLQFGTVNLAPFIQNVFRINNRFSITPGVRLEYLYSLAYGHHEDEDTHIESKVDVSQTWVFPLLGVGAQYKVTRFTNIYANWSQAYRPVEYSYLVPIGTSSKVDPNLKDAKGYNADLGWRGSYKNFLNFDVGAFYLAYQNRIGLVYKVDSDGNPYTLRTNVSDSRHFGTETYVELNLVKLFTQQSKGGYVSLFNSFSYVNATYTKGPYKGKEVEYAPKYINRLGVTYSIQNFSTTFLWSYTAKSYGDADNTAFSTDAVVGILPAYHVLDWSLAYSFLKHYHVKAGINNLANAKYITKRADEYPGPGIIPSNLRTFYLTLGAKF